MRILNCAVATLASLAFSAVLAQSEARLVIKGYDPVAYFTESKPVKGNPDISYEWDEARFHFASAANRQLFVGNPERYAPRFGGYCTASMTRGERNESDPEFWAIVDGKLYMVGTGKGREVATKAVGRLKSDPKMISTAHENWQKRAR